MRQSSIPATRRRCSRISTARSSRCRRSSPRTTMAITSAATRRCSRASRSRCSALRANRFPAGRTRSRRATRSPCRIGLGAPGARHPGPHGGHIGYVGSDADGGVAFVGDTLFAGGCGRLFEGTPAQMADSLGKLAALPTAHARLLRARVHAGEPALRARRRARECRAAGAPAARPGRSATAGCRRCRRRWPRNARRTRSCAPPNLRCSPLPKHVRAARSSMWWTPSPRCASGRTSS